MRPAGAVKNVSILFISPTPGDAAGLSSIPGVERHRDELPTPIRPNDLANYDLAIFEYATPKELPGVNTLLVMPPPGDPVFGLTRHAGARRSNCRMAPRPIRSPTG